MITVKPNGLIDCPTCNREVSIGDLTWPKYQVRELADGRLTHGGKCRCIHCKEWPLDIGPDNLADQRAERRQEQFDMVMDALHHGEY